MPRRTGVSRRSTVYAQNSPSSVQTMPVQLRKRGMSGPARAQSELRMMPIANASWPWRHPCCPLRHHGGRNPHRPHRALHRRFAHAYCRTALDAPQLVVVAPARSLHPALERALAVGRLVSLSVNLDKHLIFVLCSLIDGILYHPVAIASSRRCSSVCITWDTFNLQLVHSLEGKNEIATKAQLRTGSMSFVSGVLQLV